MRSPIRFLVPLALGLLAVSCASSARLAHQSDEALQKGDVRKAYDRALRAIEKDPWNADARAAYASVCTRVSDDYRSRVSHMARVDTLRAADLALAYAEFRDQAATHDVVLVLDPTYAACDRAVRVAVARQHYADGRRALAARLPKEAWRRFHDCRRYVPDYSDAARQQEIAWTGAVTRVAVLPFVDQAGVPGLSQQMGQKLAQDVRARGEGNLVFTQFVDRGNIDEHMTVAQMRGLSKSEATALGRQLGAQRVVSGRYFGLHSTTDLQLVSLPLYRRIATKDAQGAVDVRWEEVTMRVLHRRRDVDLQADFSVVDVRAGAVLAERTVPAHVSACVVWSDFSPQGDCGAYSLLPPEVRSADQARAQRADAQWQQTMGSWTVPAFLQYARDNRLRIRYESRYRGEFLTDTRLRPVWLGELPDEKDMAFVAADGMWRPVLDALVDLDPRDDQPIVRTPLADDSPR